MLRILFVFSNKQEKLVEGITCWKRNFNSNRYAKREVSQVNRRRRLVSRRRCFPSSKSTSFCGADTNLVLPSKARGGFQSLPVVGRLPAGMSRRKQHPQGSLEQPGSAGAVALT